MHRLRQPSVETLKRIFDLLICAPSYPTEIHNKTGLHGNTVNNALSFLVQNRLVSKERNGQRVLYSLIIANDSWYIPWVKLVRPKEEPSIHKERGRQMSKGLLRKELDRRVSNLRERFGKLVKDPLNDELIDALIELHKEDATPRLLLNKTEKPFCLECLNSNKSFFPMLLIEDSNEFCCPNCGITIPKISTETNRPTENPEEAKRRELFYSEEKKKESYTEIERLLTKYKEGKIIKKS